MKSFAASATRYIPVYLFVLVFGALVLISAENYLLFHTMAELFSISVAFTVFILAWNTQTFQQNGYLLFLGLAYLFIGLIDLLHTLAYQGMGVFPEESANLPTQLWIAARYLQSLSFLIAPFFLRRRLHVLITISAFIAVTSLLLLSIFRWQIFPDSFVEPNGLTPFKRTSEYIIAFIFLLSGVFLYLRRVDLDRDVLRWLLLSTFSAILSEIAFTEYANVYGGANMLGHLLKILSVYWIYKAIIETGFQKPYQFLFRSLKQSESDLRASHAELERRVEERTAALTLANRKLQEEIAERIRAEQELKGYQDRLEELVEERTTELQHELALRKRSDAALKSYAVQLSRSNQDLQDFAFIASHDLQEPLRKIQAFGERLVNRYADQIPAEGQDYLRRMQSAALRMQNLLNDLLAYSRVNTRPQPLRQIQLGEIAAEVLSDLEVRLEESGGRVELGELPAVQADALQMRQLFQNLIGNALKFRGPDTPPLVRVYAEHPEEENGSFRLCIEDNGIGFDEAYLERIFQPFQRLHGRSEYEGSGIGLAICRKIVERHNGSITASSAPGQGASFIVTLPLRQPDGEAQDTLPLQTSG